MRSQSAATAGNPLAMLELATDPDQLALAPEGAPLQISSRISQAFLRRLGSVDEVSHQALVLAATSDSAEVAILERAAARLGVELSALEVAERARLLRVEAGRVEFRHPLARSAIYAGASPDQRRAAHRALAAVLPDRDVDRRAWHLAAAAVGTDAEAASALREAGIRARDRSAYPTAAAAFERAARLSADAGRRARLLIEAADASWQAGFADSALGLLDQARVLTDDETLVDIDDLAGHIAIRRGSVRLGYEILSSAAERTRGERAAMMLAAAAVACFYAGDPARMLSAARSARTMLPADASDGARFMVAMALGMALTFGSDAAAGAAAIHEAIALAERSPKLRDDLQLLPWLAQAPIFLREAGTGRSLLEHALAGARARGALGALPYVLNLIARDQATTDRWAVAEASYREAIELARETGQGMELAFGLAGLAWLYARRGRANECRRCAASALELSREMGTRMLEVWTIAALGELELALGDARAAAEHFERQQRLLSTTGITDVDLFPGAELVDVYLRLGRSQDAARVAADFVDAARAKGQPWSLSRALRCSGMVAGDRDFAACFEEALSHHGQTPDAFELARTRLAYGERLRRGRSKILAREQLRQALETFGQLDADPWTERARGELAASGETLRRREPSTRDELTPQELQIGLLLAGGKTTREAAAAVFLSPKTVEYHLRHVYQKLDIHSREELTRALADQQA